MCSTITVQYGSSGKTSDSYIGKPGCFWTKCVSFEHRNGCKKGTAFKACKTSLHEAGFAFARAFAISTVPDITWEVQAAYPY
jgi:hypothetical protein